MKKLLQPFGKLCFAWVLIFMTAWSGNVFAQVTAIQVAAQSGALTYGTVGSATYLVSFNSVNPTDPISGLAVTGLPAGALASWTATSSTGSGSVTLTITTSGNTPAAVSGLTVTSTTPMLSSSPKSLTVAPRPLAVTATGPMKTYGTALTGGVTITNYTVGAGLVNGNTITGMTLTPDMAGAIATTNAGLSYMVTPSMATGAGGFLPSNYAITYNDYIGTVAQKALSVTATGLTKEYGTQILSTSSTNPADWTATGLYGMETIQSLTLTASANAINATAPAGSSYSITPLNAAATSGGFLAGNYAITYVPYTNTVAQKPISLRPNNSAPAKPYGTVLGVSIIDDTQFNLTAGSYVGTEQATGLTITPNAAGISATTVAGAVYGFTPSLATGINGFLASNYDITYQPKNNYVVTPADLTVTVTGPALTFGTAYASGTKTSGYTITGLVNGNTILSVDLTATPAITASTAAGTAYSIAPSNLVSGTGFLLSNYNFIPVPYTNTIAQKALTITPKTASFPKIYGDAKAATVLNVGVASFDVAGIAAGSGTSVSNVDVAWDAVGQIYNTPVGTSYMVTPSNAIGTGLANYLITYVANTAGKVALRPITLTAGAPTLKEYGTALPVELNSTNFNTTAGTYALGESVTAVTLTPNTAGALASTPAGASYIFTPSNATGTGGFMVSNYNITYTASTAGTVTPAPLNIVIDNRTKCQGTVLTLGTTAFSINTLTPLKNADQVTSVVLTSAGSLDTDLLASGSFGNNISMSAPSGLNFIASNYAITQNRGNLDITAAPFAASITSPTQTVCRNVAITPITYTTTNATGIGTPVGLPTGVTAVWNLNVLTVSGIPTSPAGASYTYSIPLIGCDMTKVATGTITLSPDATVSAGPTTAAPLVVCNNILMPVAITHSTSGVTSITAPTGGNALPPGVTATFNTGTGVITISGTPNYNFAPGSPEEIAGFKTYNYNITLTGSPCATTQRASGSIKVLDNNVAIPSPANTTICQNSAMVPLVITTTNATGIGTATGLPAGITASWAANKISISGSSSALPGSYAFVIPLTGGCGALVNAIGTITIGSVTVTPPSSTPTVCSGVAMPNVTHTTTGATAIANNNVAGANGLPPGVKAVWAAGEITISGTPTGPSQVYNYSISLSCGAVAATGTITVVANTVTAGSTRTGCQGSALTAFTHTTTGATGIDTTTTGLPAGVTATWAANVITISGTPSVSGSFAYSIPLTGGCGTVSATGTITVASAITIAAATTPTANCSTGAIAPITHTASAPITGIVSSVGIPAGLTATFTGSVLTLSGTPTGAPTGTFPYTVVVSGACGTATATGSIIFVSPTVPTIAVTGGTMISSAVAGNQWYTCAGVIVPGATSNVFLPSVVGSYKVRVTVGSCTVESACASVTLKADTFDSKAFSYYPNPVNNELFLSYSKDITSVKVVNILGQVMSSSSNKATSATVDMSNFPAGLYLVEVKSLDESKTIKVMKN